jgi:adenine-specific DNA-methyltransferase
MPVPGQVGSTNALPAPRREAVLDEVTRFGTRVEARRIRKAAQLGKNRALLGQFFTPPDAASRLAAMAMPKSAWRLLDPGAGVGSLTAALVCRWLLETGSPEMEVVAYEVDENLISGLRETLAEAVALAAFCGRTLRTRICQGDFVLQPPPRGECNLVLMNPPYRKLSTQSAESISLRSGEDPVRVTNLYAAFLVRARRALSAGGQLIAITPRSFANGPYFSDLRGELLDHASFDQIHVFTARNRVFSDADVLQENMIFSMIVGADPADVLLSYSADASSKAEVRTCAHSQVVHPEDQARFIRLPLDQAAVRCAEEMLAMPAALADLGVSVSTGRVVDFRVREHLCAVPETGSVPLVYPQNIRDGEVCWPVAGRKPQALAKNDQTSALLLPNEHYVVVKRFTSKEEPRRVVAAVSSPDAFPVEEVAFENHLNVFHCGGRGLDVQLAKGLAGYLNSTLVDQYVRQFNGHTQINATDLREIRYPSTQGLRALGSANLGWDESVEREDLVEAAAS